MSLADRLLLGVGQNDTYPALAEGVVDRPTAGHCGVDKAEVVTDRHAVAALPEAASQRGVPPLNVRKGSFRAGERARFGGISRGRRFSERHFSVAIRTTIPDVFSTTAVASADGGDTSSTGPRAGGAGREGSRVLQRRRAGRRRLSAAERDDRRAGRQNARPEL